jgi:thioesterase domain-containing protein
LIGGYSGGGLVALEMAQRLVAASERVGVLVLVDTFSPFMRLREVTLGTRLRRLRDEGTSYLREAVHTQVRHLGLFAQTRRLAAVLARDADVPEELRDLRLTLHFERVASAYRPHPYVGRTLLFRPRVTAHVFADGGVDNGWGALISKDLEIVRVPGDHDTLLLEPNATTLLRSLQRALDDQRPEALGASAQALA